MASRFRGVFQDRAHLVTLGALALTALAVFVGARQLALPSDFGRYGHFRAGALDDNRVHPLHYAGRAACAACHDEEAAQLAQGKHARLGCEACHGPLSAHAEDPSSAPGRRPPGGRAFCLRCHALLSARPANFPQVEARDHGEDQPCVTCHTPHRPGV